MKKLSMTRLAELVSGKRKEKSMTQQELADATGINRSLLSRLEKKDFIPSIPQLESLGECLGFDPDEAFTALYETKQNGRDGYFLFQKQDSII